MPTTYARSRGRGKRPTGAVPGAARHLHSAITRCTMTAGSAVIAVRWLSIRGCCVNRKKYNV